MKWRLSHPRRREDCRTRRRKEYEKHVSAEHAGCWAHHRGTECEKGHAVLIALGVSLNGADTSFQELS